MNSKDPRSKVCACEDHKGKHFSIVLLQIDEKTPQKSLADVKKALKHAANVIRSQRRTQ
jgi:hypothetical protein